MAHIIGRPETIQNRRWILASNVNGQACEEMLESQILNQLMHKTDSNGLVFNYPGVGSSPGWASRQSLVKAYKAMLQLLEDEKNGIGATDIICYGLSIGGAVQGEALLNHSFKEHINYVFIKDRTFSDLSKVADSLIFRPVGQVVKLFGWNMSPTTSSKALAKPEIILQSHKKSDVRVYQTSDINPFVIKDDGIISAKDSLATALLTGGTSYQYKYFIGLDLHHNQQLSSDSLALNVLVEKINDLLQKQRQSNFRYFSCCAQ